MNTHVSGLMMANPVHGQRGVRGEGGGGGPGRRLPYWADTKSMLVCGSTDLSKAAFFRQGEKDYEWKRERGEREGGRDSENGRERERERSWALQTYILNPHGLTFFFIQCPAPPRQIESWL